MNTINCQIDAHNDLRLNSRTYIHEKGALLYFYIIYTQKVLGRKIKKKTLFVCRVNYARHLNIISWPFMYTFLYILYLNLMGLINISFVILALLFYVYNRFFLHCWCSYKYYIYSRSINFEFIIICQLPSYKITVVLVICIYTIRYWLK